MPDSLEFPRKPVLILGASGYIGSRLAAALAQNRIYRPIAASRHSALSLDATNPLALQSALRGVDSVVNCVAGREQTMIRAAQALSDAARQASVRRIIQLSSMAVYGAATGLITEKHQPVEPVSAYGRAKRACETIMQAYAAEAGEVVILRPTCVFGPHSPQWTTRLIHLLRAGRIGDLGPAGDGCCNLAFIDDLVAAIIAALDAPDTAGHTFNINGPCNFTWNRLLMDLGRSIGATPIRRIPPWRLRIETKMLAPVRRAARVIRKTAATEAIPRSLASLWQQDIRIDSTAAQATLGLQPTPLETMVRAVAQVHALRMETET